MQIIILIIKGSSSRRVRWAAGVAAAVMLAACSDVGGGALVDGSVPDAAPIADAEEIDSATDSSADPAKQCAQLADDQSRLCLENGVGAPGQTVAIEIHLVAKKGCGALDQAMGEISFDGSALALANGTKTITNCRTRDPRTKPDSHIYWHAFTAEAVGPRCPTHLAPGEVDVLQIEVKATAAPGDYPLAWRNQLILSKGDPGCESQEGVDAIVRVR